MEKQYVAGKLDGEQARYLLAEIGLTDDVDGDRLLAALDVIREFGAALPSEPTNGATKREDDKATEAQLTLIKKLLHEKGVSAEDSPASPLTKTQAHEIIDTLKAGTYDAAKWTVPF
jgi:hypothetical protein